MLEWQKIERNGTPWQPSFLFEDGTHSNSKHSYASLTTAKHLIVWTTQNYGRLRAMGVPEHLIVLLHNLYDSQEATERTEVGETDYFGIGKGVRQGCILSSTLINLYAENIMQEAGMDEAEEDI